MRAITKAEAIKKIAPSGARRDKFRFLEWIKLPLKGRLLIFETKMIDFIDPDYEVIETRYHLFPVEGGGSGGSLGSRREKR